MRFVDRHRGAKADSRKPPGGAAWLSGFKWQPRLGLRWWWLGWGALAEGELGGHGADGQFELVLRAVGPNLHETLHWERRLDCVNPGLVETSCHNDQGVLAASCHKC